MGTSDYKHTEVKRERKTVREEQRGKSERKMDRAASKNWETGVGGRTGWRMWEPEATEGALRVQGSWDSPGLRWEWGPASRSLTPGTMLPVVTELYAIGQWVGLLWWLSSKESACNAGDSDLLPGSGRSPGGGHQYFGHLL